MTTLHLYEQPAPVPSSSQTASIDMSKDALELVRKILEPKRLSYIQELVFYNLGLEKSIDRLPLSRAMTSITLKKLALNCGAPFLRRWAKKFLKKMLD